MRHFMAQLLKYAKLAPICGVKQLSNKATLTLAY